MRTASNVPSPFCANMMPRLTVEERYIDRKRIRENREANSILPQMRWQCHVDRDAIANYAALLHVASLMLVYVMRQKTPEDGRVWNAKIGRYVWTPAYRFDRQPDFVAEPTKKQPIAFAGDGLSEYRKTRSLDECGETSPIARRRALRLARYRLWARCWLRFDETHPDQTTKRMVVVHIPKNGANSGEIMKYGKRKDRLHVFQRGVRSARVYASQQSVADQFFGSVDHDMMLAVEKKLGVNVLRHMVTLADRLTPERIRLLQQSCHWSSSRRSTRKLLNRLRAALVCVKSQSPDDCPARLAH